MDHYIVEEDLGLYLPDEHSLKDKVFDLRCQLPEIKNEDERQLVEEMGELCRKIMTVQRAGYQLPEEQLHPLFNKLGDVEDCAQAGVLLGFIFMILHEYPAMRDVYRRLNEKHGELAPLLFYQALAEEKLGNVHTAIDLMHRIIARGERNYWVFYIAGRILYQQGQFSESITMTNLAVYENDNHVEPFILLAKNFHSCNQLDKMLECFSRVEKMQGDNGLKQLGFLYDAYRDMYKNTKKLLHEEK